jgi:AcrR family transcriptional regulator
VELADREGLEAVSIRRVAAELRMRPMSLYTYIASKEELLARMAESIVGEVLVEEPLPADWRQAVELVALRSHRTFVRHPWVLAISQGQAQLGPSGVRHAEQLLTAIEPLGLSAKKRWRALFLINDYTLGHALRAAQVPAGPTVYPDVDPDRFPRLAAALKRPGPARDEETFRRGLRMLLDALESQAR